MYCHGCLHSLVEIAPAEGARIITSPPLKYMVAFRLILRRLSSTDNIAVVVVHRRSIRERHRRLGFIGSTMGLAVSVPNSMFMALLTERTRCRQCRLDTNIPSRVLIIDRVRVSPERGIHPRDTSSRLNHFPVPFTISIDGSMGSFQFHILRIEWAKRLWVDS